VQRYCGGGVKKELQNKKEQKTVSCAMAIDKISTMEKAEIYKIKSPAIPSYFCNSLISKKFCLQWLVLSQDGIENTADLHVSYKESPTYSYIYKLFIQTYIICNYTCANMLLTGALISSNTHDISHHIGAKICKIEHFLAN
jgi:hypothetical protein